MGRYPKRTLIGVVPSVALTWSLCTAEATMSHWLQSPCWVFATRHRYCSTHWFLRSDSPSVWGWNAVDKFCLTPSLLAIRRDTGFLAFLFPRSLGSGVYNEINGGQ